MKGYLFVIVVSVSLVGTAWAIAWYNTKQDASSVECFKANGAWDYQGCKPKESVPAPSR